MRNNRHNTIEARRPTLFTAPDRISASGARPLDVNVIFTDPAATRAALQSAAALARDLGAHLRVRAAVVVPLHMPLDQPLVPLRFTEQLLCDMICEMGLQRLEPTIHLYLCRDNVDALMNVLPSNSMVVLGTRWHWWPGAQGRMAKALRAKGHHVILVDTKTAPPASLQTRGDKRPVAFRLERELMVLQLPEEIHKER